ncbi:MAG TPA: zf-HC2 domain-containing protein [Alphaproteobacteria bacterium]|nr:zf-HC2 domain-containing protein [Alphaproteobacteria bacterium]
MKYQNRKPEEVLNEAVKAMRSQDAGPDAVKAATERVWQRLNEDATARSGELGSIRGCEDVRGLLPQYRRSELSPARALLVEDHLRECVACRKEAETGERPRAAALPWHQELARPTMPHFRWAMAAVALIAVGVSGYFVQGYFASPSGSRAQVASVS